MPFTTGKALSYANSSTNSGTADVADWKSRVIAAGGTVSTTRENAVLTFANSAYTDGFRSTSTNNHAILHCIPFAVDPGSPIAAIFEPLWRPSGITGSGSGLSSGNYTTSGYAFSGSNYYDTGLAINTLDSTNIHTGIHLSNVTLSGSNEAYGATDNAASPQKGIRFQYSTGSNAGPQYGDREAFTSVTAGNVAGFNLANRISSGAALEWYNDGSLIASGSTSNSRDTVLPAFNFYLGARSSPDPVSFSNETLGFFSIGKSISNISAYNTAVSALRTAIESS